MITILFIFLIAIFDSIRDIIRIPETFNASFFSRYKGNQWIDPQVSWTNKNWGWWIFRPVIAMFSDLWHTCKTIVISLFLLLAFTYQLPEYVFNNLIMALICWLIYGYCLNLFLGTWKTLKKQ